MKRVRSMHEPTQRNVETIAKIEAAFDSHRTLGERVADVVAATVGSWPFIIGQSVFLVAWMALNVVAWFEHWDPYPFILLNLALSFQAAYAGPIIMMSQNRQARQDRRRNQLDLQINLLSEQENTEILRLLRKIGDKLGIPPEEGAPSQALAQATRPEALVRQIERSAERPRNDPGTAG